MSDRECTCPEPIPVAEVGGYDDAVYRGGGEPDDPIDPGCPTHGQPADVPPENANTVPAHGNGVSEVVERLEADLQAELARGFQSGGLSERSLKAIHTLQAENAALKRDRDSEEAWAEEYFREWQKLEAYLAILQTTYKGCCAQYEKLEAENKRLRRVHQTIEEDEYGVVHRLRAAAERIELTRMRSVDHEWAETMRDGITEIHRIAAENELIREMASVIGAKMRHAEQGANRAEAERDRLREGIRAMFIQKYGDHTPEKWEWAAQGKEAILARLLPEHKHYQAEATALNREDKGVNDGA